MSLNGYFTFVFAAWNSLKPFRTTLKKLISFRKKSADLNVFLLPIDFGVVLMTKWTSNSLLSRYEMNFVSFPSQVAILLRNLDIYFLSSTALTTTLKTSLKYPSPFFPAAPSNAHDVYFTPPAFLMISFKWLSVKFGEIFWSDITST